MISVRHVQGVQKIRRNYENALCNLQINSCNHQHSYNNHIGHLVQKKNFLVVNAKEEALLKKIIDMLFAFVFLYSPKTLQHDLLYGKRFNPARNSGTYLKNGGIEMAEKIMQGLRVVDMSIMIAGPTTSRTLGDWGADVIKIENYNGDTLRPLGMNLMSPIDDDENPTFHIANANKRLIPVNLKTPTGLEIVHKLLTEADVFITSFRQEALVRLGLDYDTLSLKYPKLIYAHVLGYGEKGELKDRAAFDFSTYFGRSGFMDIIADREGPPPFNAPAFGDNQLALSLLAGINAALYNREKTGKGDYVHASLYHVGIYALGFVHAADYYEHTLPGTHTDPQSPLVTVYKCSDGKWLYIASPDYITYFPKVCNLLGMPEFGQDEEYNDIMGMLMHKIEIRDRIQEKIIEKTSLEWAELFAAESIPAERIFSSKDVREDPQVYANDFMKWVTHGNGNKSPMATTPTRLRSMGNGFDYEFLPGGIGAEAKEILGEMGYSEDDMKKLKDDGVINFGEFL